MSEPDEPLERELRAASAPADDVEAKRWRASVAARLFGRTQGPVSIGRYRVIERIGSGANGVVYAAIDPELDRKVAVKVLHGDRATASPDALAREAKVLAKLSHPNVVPVYDLGVHDGRVFLTLELVEGTTLRTWLETPRPWRDSVSLFAQAGRGLAAAHAAGVVHRDFKPENALIGTDGRVRVSDFGIARWLESMPDDTVSSPSPSTRPVDASQRAGTPAYMAPEQFLGDPVDARTDQFSFCVALHEAVYGKRPFAGRDRATLAANVIAGRRRTPTDPKCPRWLERAIARGLRTDPRERWPDMTALVGELEGDRKSGAMRWASAVLLGAGVAGIAFAVSERGSASADVCAGAGDRMTEVWSDARGRRIRDAFAATGLPYADERGERMVGELDRFADAWYSAQSRACEGVDDALAVQRLYCLQSRLLELDSLAGALAEADAEVVEFAVQSGNALRSPEDCLFVATTPSVAGAPVDDREESVAMLRRTIARARALHNTGKLRNGLEVARDAARAAQDLADRSLEAEALLVAGEIEQHLLGVEPGIDATTTIYAGVLAAESAHRPDLHAQALVDYVAVLVATGEFERARTWAPRAREAVAAIGDPPELAGRIDLALGLSLGFEDRYDESIAALQSAHDHFVRSGAASRGWLSYATNCLGEMKFDRGKYLEARGDYERTIELAKEAFGPKHAAVASGYGNLAETYYVIGDYAGAEPLFRESLAIRREVFGDRSVWAVHSFAHVGDVLYELGHFDEALATYEEGLAARIALQPTYEQAQDGELLSVYRDLQTFGQEAWLRNGIAMCMMEQGRDEDALAQASITVDVELPADSHHPDLVARIDLRGHVLLALDRDAEALAHFEAVLPRLEARYPEGARAVATTLVGLGRARVELGREADAVAPLERALALLDGTPDADLRLQGRARFALAQALDALGRPEPAKAAARTALAALERSSLPAADERAEVDAWLGAHE